MKPDCKHSTVCCEKCAKMRASYARWYARNAEAHQAKMRERYAASIAERRAANARRQAKRRKRADVRADESAYYAANRARYLARQREWRRKNAARFADQQRRGQSRRRAGRRLLTEPFSLGDLAARNGGLCYLCSLPLGGDTTLDHVVPLSAGGQHVESNAAAVHWACNARKGSRSLLVAMIRYPKFHKAPFSEGIVRTA